jgi:sugar phosphate isomerase/epimerase
MKRSPAPKIAPVLKQFAGIWTMIQQPSAAKEWTMDEKFKQAKKAGFDAVGWNPIPEAPALCEKYGLEYMCYIDANGKNYKEKLEAARATRPVRINVQLCDHDTPPAEAVRVWLKLEPLAEKMGLNADLEVHRDTCTETPEKVYEIAALYKKATGRKLRFCWDFSHIAVVKHLSPPYAERLLTHPGLVQLARQFHFRPFNGHHCQIPATDGKGNETPEFKAYLEFLDALIACWMKGAKGGEVVYACPEFGPVASGYGLPSFANVWKDAILLRGKTQALWEANLKRAWRA